MIEKTVLGNTEDQYSFATVYNQELGFYAFRQDMLSNLQWCGQFNTKLDVGEAIGVTQKHRVLLEYVAQEIHTQTFSDLTKAEQLVVREDAKECYLLYDLLRQSGIQHGNLKVDLQNDFTTGDNRYQKNRQQTLHLLKKYRNTAVQRMTQFEGTAFVQGRRFHQCGRIRGNRGRRGNKTPEKEYWNDKECFN